MNLKKEYSEENLIAGIKQDDHQSLKYLYKAYFSMILHLVTNNNGSEQEAKDIYQEAVIVLYEKLKQDSFELTCKIKTFLYSVCRRLWLKRLAEKNRYGGKINDYEDFLPFEDEGEEMDEQEQQYQMMMDSMLQLGEPCKTILEDFYIKKMSMQDITAKMGYTNTANAKNQKYKCMIRLKKIFFKEYKMQE